MRRMRPLDAEDKKKIALAVLMLAIVSYGFYQVLLTPSFKQRNSYIARIAQLESSIATANKNIQQSKNLEETTRAERETIEALFDNVQKGSVIAWMPTRLEGFFERQGITARVAPQGRSITGAKISGYQVSSWGTSFGGRSVFDIGSTVAAFENWDPLMEIVALSISVDNRNPEFQQASLTVEALLPNE